MNFEHEELTKAYPDNTVVGYYIDKAIVKAEDGTIYYCHMPKELVTLGETISPRDLLPLRMLPDAEARKINIMYGGGCNA